MTKQRRKRGQEKEINKITGQAPGVVFFRKEKMKGEENLVYFFMYYICAGICDWGHVVIMYLCRKQLWI